MSKRYPRAKWVLPAVVDPPRRCYTIRVPDEQFHVAAFLGVLQDLGSGMQWADDDAHTAKDVAQVWRQVIDEIERDGNCMDDPCNDVNIPFDPDLSGNFTLHVIAGHFNAAPTYVKPGDTLTLINASGVWRDGILFVSGQSNWYRFDGGDYTDILTPAPTQPTDILTSIPHMALIGRFDDNGAPYYWQLGAEFGGANSIVVPMTVDPLGVLFELFANGPLLSDSAYDLSAFQPHGELCVVLEIVRGNFCPQIFVNFDEPLPTGVTLLSGTIEPASPIADGPACLLEAVSPTASTAFMEFLTDDCTAHNFAFTIDVENSEPGSSFGYTWTLRNAANVILDSGLGGIPFTNGVVASQTVDFGDVPGVSKIEIHWNFTSSLQFDPDLAVWLDNVFIN